ncbi:MAG: CBS domain-containing protein [Gammaproteobacteria bacterium]|nr:CBS domain-containing protein [Gammaproteobacteria bacterium]MCW8910067.1 CBS domain-containing protein [Gammaproteobacteria bacterium]MCW9004819.1 CBS domain-containing protein [Gammaproteobacteria bacterium]MCW9055177.1 CBS domain-containing protein [Gammaproteobacteria bacterium]
MKVRDIMTTKVESIEPTAVLRKAARKMSELNIGSMAVVDDDGKLLGIITDRDISVYAIAMGRNPQDTEVQKVMTRDVATCLADQDISDAATIMQQQHIRRLAVMDNNLLSGFLSVDDLAKASSDLAGAVLVAATPIH